jgi:hypothetical protein
MKYADLHIHTKFSDGTFTPERVVNEARRRDLSCIAITDHDTVYAIEPALKEANKQNIELIPGVELTTEENKYEIHILGYFIDWQQEWFNHKLAQMCKIRKQRALEIIEKLRAYGIRLDPDEFLSAASPGSVGRLHIAQLLQKRGFVSSFQEAFERYLGFGRPCYVRKFKLSPKEGIQMICRLQGLAILAHPHVLANDELIIRFRQWGLRGIEVYYPEYTRAITEYYKNLAQKYGLLITGGSDCHGWGKERILMGEVKIPYSLVELLKQEVEALRSE